MHDSPQSNLITFRAPEGGGSSLDRSASSSLSWPGAAAGTRAYELIKELFPICRSITGPGIRDSLKLLQRQIPEMVLREIATGTKCFDWVVPQEWSIREAYIEAENGERLVDFKRHNLHVVSYSTPIDAVMSFQELRPHLHSIPEMPDAIPYVTSYYSPRWGFCLSHRQLLAMKEGTYRVKVDSTLKAGHLTYGEVLLPGQTSEEIFLSTYLCHPSMANNELSGPAVVTELLSWLRKRPQRKYTIRVLIGPETIGAIAYLSENLHQLQSNVVAGFNVSCVGDQRVYSYLPSRSGQTLADRAALHALTHHAGPKEFIHYSYLDRGSDERQYCSPGIDLPVVSIMRSKYGSYPEYHTSLDDLTLVSPEGLSGAIDAHAKAIVAIEQNSVTKATVKGEPQLGPRGLYPTLGTRSGSHSVRTLMNLLAYSDGKHDLLSIASILSTPIWELSSLVQLLTSRGLLQNCDDAAVM